MGVAKLKNRGKTNRGTTPWVSTTRGTYQLMAGIAYDINKNWTFKIGYKFFDAFTSKIKHAHGIEAGIRYNF